MSSLLIEKYTHWKVLRNVAIKMEKAGDEEATQMSPATAAFIEDPR